MITPVVYIDDCDVRACVCVEKKGGTNLIWLEAVFFLLKNFSLKSESCLTIRKFPGK